MVSISNRLQRIAQGWSANMVQLLLGITQQVALVPIFLHFQNSDMLAAWLVLYATGNLVLVADFGLHARAMNRFLSFRSGIDPDGSTARYYSSMLRLYAGLAGALIAAMLVATTVIQPSRVLGFQPVPHFDLAFAVLCAGMLATLPGNLAAALYRARGLYGRGVWIVSAAQLVAQIGQVAAIVTTGDLLVITMCYVAPMVAVAIYILAIDIRRCFPFLNSVVRRAIPSWRWSIGQLRRAFPFAVAGGAEIAVQNLSVLLVSALIADRVAVAQWGVTRVVAGLLRAVCTQVAQPLAAELGHDQAVGATDRLASLYARGSVLVTFLASVLVGALLAFWGDFFVLWTGNVIPYDVPLTFTLLIGSVLGAPGILALAYAYCSDRGKLLAQAKGLQLVVFLVLSLILTRQLGALGMAIAIVASDLLVQCGWLGSMIVRHTLRSPVRHFLFLVLVVALTLPCGWMLGTLIRWMLPGSGWLHFIAECGLWVCVLGLLSWPFLSARRRAQATGIIPN